MSDQRQLTHKPTGEREVLLFYEAYDMGLQAGLQGARVAVRQAIVEHLSGWSLWQLDTLRQVVEEGVSRAEAMRAEVDAKIKEIEELKKQEKVRR